LSRFIAATFALERIGSSLAHLTIGRGVARSGRRLLGDAVLTVRWALVEGGNQFQARGKQPLAEGCGQSALCGWNVLAEVFEVLAVVEDKEKFLVLARFEQVRAQSRAAPEHLPELVLRAHELEEKQVHNLRDVDAGVEHIH
jgi:hypothetical protein